VVSDLQRVDASTGSNTAWLTLTVIYSYTLGNLSGIGYPSSRQLGMGWVDGERHEVERAGLRPRGPSSEVPAG